MTHLVRVDGAGAGVIPEDGDKTVDLISRGDGRNVLIEPDQYVRATFEELPGRLRDLFLIAGALYAADSRISRGSIKDAFNDAWRRDIVLHVWVHDLAFWSDPPVVRALRDAVEFLTGDSIRFVFEQSVSVPLSPQSLLPTDLVPPHIRESNTVLLLSGGLDSLAAALQAQSEGRRPLLVSHRPAPQLQARQENVVGLLRETAGPWPWPHISVLLHAVAGRRPSEFTQRSRAFLYASLGAIATHLCGAHELLLCDNGVVTLNLPPTGQCVGTTLSRSTHPGYLRRLERFLRRVLEDDTLRVSNTLEMLTKREVVQLIARQGSAAMIQETVSCAHTEGRTKGAPHCGLCTQCIDRRFATVAAGLEEHDIMERYEQDVFTAHLAEGAARMHVENYLRFAHELAQYGEANVFALERGIDLTDAMPEVGIDEYVQSVFELFRRHQVDVHAVVEAKLKEYAAALARGELPQHCLLKMTGASDVRTSPKEVFVEKLIRVLCESIPLVFQHEAPKNESAMQDAGEACLKAADEQLDREAPQIPFGTVGVRPDFSKTVRGEDALFVEFKLLKAKTGRNRIHSEIAADILQYPQDAWLLFVVYDPPRGIRDDQKFCRDLEAKRQNVRVVVIR